ncbi:tRNA (N(6)-L-threonylcarbamoyladenosine(37)-C(2))-methylthiotransferase MtaB [Gracilinema caldarium]|uniref:MiaB-like tRNA modifying enzyme n=1 Tax=Gracilinema caldarium (strain ATCC 51460 / DSM 7334 / H1) TaxID=744872 RepID=F8F0F3_GRAC1|nr:tRNA (N(6)-L-threonylcarbamoyladenosine(37)-C(2))-methylthiotransferase MtaB [Gracilinema caldarium]AEJ19297.1 MiaB-like tRNA modifying enzyme [Gracilinema caldarium DSM 7334]
MLSVCFHTLGCKLNQLETESIAESFKKEGFALVDWGDAADIFVINTCTVTSKAEQKARRMIRKALRDNPAACLIATGCYAQLDGKALESLASDGRIFVVSGDLKSVLLDLPAYLMDNGCTSVNVIPLMHRWILDWYGTQETSGAVPPQSVDPFRFNVQDYSFHSRAFLKIQDGCNNACAFCRVRLARGRSVSLSAPLVLERLQQLEAHGFAEVVLTGVNLNQYKDGAMDFTALLEYLLGGTKSIALRISSTEPEGVDERFSAVFAHPRIRPHIHLSVQSGSDRILQKMRRRYRAEKVKKAVELLRQAKGDPFIACDIITGFPGETDDDFAETYELCKQLDFSWIHAFPYSPRPGTEAYTMQDRVSETVSGQRLDRLLKLAEEGKAAYITRWIGKKVSAIVEHNHSDNGFVVVTDNYLKAWIPLGAGLSHPTAKKSITCTIQRAIDSVDPINDIPHDSIDVVARCLDTQYNTFYGYT